MPGALPLEVEGRRRGVVGEDSLAGVIALLKPDALAA
jgi:hypothetical protein